MFRLWPTVIKITAIFLIFSPQLQAQLKVKFEYYSTENGLSHDAVTNIIKDREGFIWIGTWNGINRFDGHDFKSYKSFPGDLSQLKNDRIDRIVEDHSDNLWIKAYDHQIYRFNKCKEQFYPFLIKAGKQSNKIMFDRVKVLRSGAILLVSSKDGLIIIPDPGKQERYIHVRSKLHLGLKLPSDTIRFVYEDLNRQLWISTAKGMYCIAKNKNGKYVTVKLDEAIFSSINSITCAEDKSNIYFGTDRGDIISYSKDYKKTIKKRVSRAAINMLLASKTQGLIYASSASGELISIRYEGRNISKSIYDRSENLHSIYEDRSGNIWIEPDQSGVIRFSPTEQKFKRFTSKNDEGSSYKGNHYKVFEDKKGIVWVNMKGGGLAYYDAQKSNMEALYDITGLAEQRYSNIITSLFYDDNGVLWFSTIDKGVTKAILQDDNFTQQLLTPLPRHKSQNDIRGIWTDKKQRIWLGVRSSDLCIFKNGKKVQVTFCNLPKNGLGEIYCILEDSKGNVWMGTKANGLYKASPLNPEHTSFELSHYGKGVKGSDDLNSNEIYALMEDRHGKIWIGTFDEGPNVAIIEKGLIKFLNRYNGLNGYPVEGFKKIRNLSLDQKGNVWIGTTNGLVVKHAGDAKQPGQAYNSYSKIPGSKQSLGNNDVQFIFRDSRNIMWLATSGGGLAKAIGKDPFSDLTFRNYTTRDGLPNDYVLSCAEDKQGYIWAATQNGLTRFDPGREEFKNYDSYDGLPKVTFSEASAQKLSNGTIVFGTNRGYLSFRPDQIKNYHTQANMVLTNLQINNEDQLPSTDGVLQSNINYIDALELKYNQNIISIDFAVLDPKSSPKQVYAYRLNGFETTWNTNSAQRRATYTNLPPGHYVFEVKSLNKGVYVKVPYKRLEINILPPPWKTWWAYLIYIFLISIAIEIIRRTAMTMLRLRNKILVEQKLAELKSNFFTHISHELRTPLTLILNPIEEIRRNNTLNPEGLAQIEIVRKNSNRMIRFINQLLDLRKLQSGKAKLTLSHFDLIPFLKNISGYFEDLAFKKNIILEFLCEQNNVKIWADAEKLDIVFYNLLSNAFKFSPDNKTIKIIVSSNPLQDEVSLEVYDQGKGVKEDNLEEIFELYYQEKEYSDTLQKGSGIGLALSKELVELHQGKIFALRNADSGLSIHISLPLGKEHLKVANFEVLNSNDVDILNTPLNNCKEIFSEPTPEQGSMMHSTVLLVEDNTDLRNFLSSQLGRIYKVETASDGMEGWESAQRLMPDLILSDIMMPRMSGITLLDKLKNNIATSHIPVVLLSAKYSIEHQIEGLRYGADYYITKPFNNDFLFAAIAGLIRQRKSLFNSLVEKKAYVSLEPTPIVITERDKVFLEKVIEIVEQHMEDCEFNIDSVAETIGMGRSTFYRKFKSLTNLAPVEFVRDIRLKRAKQYFDAGEKSISSIAYTVGFNDAKYFSKCFKEKYHVSPSDYLRAKSKLTSI